MTIDHPVRPRFLTITILAAAAGTILCVLQLAGIDLPCLTTGCSIYGDYALFGLPIYGYGAAGFAVILILALAALYSPAARKVLGLAVLAGLIIDTLFLGWQVLYWPCLNCLHVALLLGVAAVGCVLAFPDFRRWVFLSALALWLLVFIPVVTAVGKEVLLTPWSLAGADDAAIRVFFSPTCPACATAVGRILDNPTLTSRTVFYPVAKEEEDVRRLARLVQSGPAQPVALRQLFAPGPVVEASPTLSLRLRLAQNKMALARLGEGTLPLILSSSVVETAPILHPFSEIGVEPVFVPGFQEPGCSVVATPAEDCP